MNALNDSIKSEAFRFKVFSNRQKPKPYKPWYLVPDAINKQRRFSAHIDVKLSKLSPSILRASIGLLVPVLTVNLVNSFLYEIILRVVCIFV